MLYVNCFRNQSDDNNHQYLLIVGCLQYHAMEPSDHVFHDMTGMQSFASQAADLSHRGEEFRQMSTGFYPPANHAAILITKGVK